jgi:hypothetical protein
MRHHANATPYVAVFNKASNETTIADRLFRPLVTIPGRYPRCDYQRATVCPPDAERLYGAAGTTILYHNDNGPVADPVVRQRLRTLLVACPVLAAEIERRSAEKESAKPAPQSHADLIAATFGERATA